MRVLLITDGFGIPGGHTVQPTRTAAALRAIGVDVTTAEPGAHDFSAFDVTHGFGVSRDLLRSARRSGTAVVVSPIWWSIDYLTGQMTRTPLHRRMSRLVRIGASAVRRGVHGTAHELRKRFVDAALTFELADMLLPNSNLEASQIRSDLGVTTPMHVVPNAFDHCVFTPPDSEVLRDGVLYVGRLEPHKNQLGLIRELRGTSIQLTIVGPDHPHHSRYARECRAAADAMVTFVGAVEHEALRELYRAAAVHVLPSWFETTGLVSLEAAATGCAVVTTDRGYAREYFGDLAFYCDPGRKGSIRSAVESALTAPPSPQLRERVLGNYTWDHAARATRDAYEAVLR